MLGVVYKDQEENLLENGIESVNIEVRARNFLCMIRFIIYEK